MSVKTTETKVVFVSNRHVMSCLKRCETGTTYLPHCVFNYIRCFILVKVMKTAVEVLTIS